MKDKNFVQDYFSAKQKNRKDKIEFLGMAAMVIFFLAAIIH